MEQQLDAELEQLDRMEEDDIEKMRERRFTASSPSNAARPGEAFAGLQDCTNEGTGGQAEADGNQGARQVRGDLRGEAVFRVRCPVLVFSRKWPSQSCPQRVEGE